VKTLFVALTSSKHGPQQVLAIERTYGDATMGLGPAAEVYAVRCSDTVAADALEMMVRVDQHPKALSILRRLSHSFTLVGGA
jgi:hypothetical protein